MLDTQKEPPPKGTFAVCAASLDYKLSIDWSEETENNSSFYTAL